MATLINNVTRKIPVWVVYLLLIIPGGYLTYGLFFGGLGPDPIRTYEHKIGELALQLIVLGLLITPLRDWLKINLIKYRRAIGLMAFYYVLAHLAAYVVLDQGLDWREIWKDIVKRPYITFGMIAAVIMLPMAITSNNRLIRKMGPKRWQFLHRAVYIVAILAMMHFLLLTKTIRADQVFYAISIAILLGHRGWKTYQTRWGSAFRA